MIIVRKSFAGFAAEIERANPVCNIALQSSHVYSFWHHGREVNRGVFTDIPQFP